MVQPVLQNEQQVVDLQKRCQFWAKRGLPHDSIQDLGQHISEVSPPLNPVCKLLRRWGTAADSADSQKIQ